MHFSEQPILKDFELFLRYVQHKQPLILTNTKRCLRTADLLELNSKMSVPARLVNAKSQQTAFSLLNTFFHIANSAALLKIVIDSRKSSNNTTLQLNEPRIDRYNSLNPDEQYFFLLEVFWQYLDHREAYGSTFFLSDDFYTTLLKHPSGKRLTISDPLLKRSGQLKPAYDVPLLEVMETFGCFQLQWDQNLETRAKEWLCPYQAITMTDLGKTMVTMLWYRDPNEIRYFYGKKDPYMSENIVHRAWDFEDAASEEVQEEVDYLTGKKFLQRFQHYFPLTEIKERLFPIERSFQEGTYTLRVALDKNLYRIIAMDAQSTLEDLHDAIQAIYKFDDDHLYAFFMDNVAWSQSGDAYYDPRGEMDDQKPAYLFKLGELGLYLQKAFLYVFDFGDNWQFHITVEAIEATTSKTKNGYRLIETKGKAPAQYDWEDDEEEEDEEDD